MLNIDELLIPFWEGSKVFGESVMMMSEDGQIPCAELFYKPEKILSVKSSDLKTEYKRGIDWELKQGKLVMLDGASMPFMRKEDCHFYDKKDEDCFKAKDGGYILYKRNGYFHKRNLCDKDKIEAIREETYFLYLLILGSIKLTPSDIEKLS